MDVYGDHALTCSCGGDRTIRHNHIRNNAFHFCLGAGLNPELEKPGLLQPRPLQGALPEDGVRRDNPDARRPADAYLPRWHRGVPAALDFAVTSGLRPSNISAALHDPKAVTRNYEDFKNSYLNTRSLCSEEGIDFVPIIIEAVGGSWGPTATKVFYNLAKAKSSITGESKNTILNQLRQTLGTTLHKANARSILRRCSLRNFDAHSLLSAAATIQGQAAEPANT